MTQIFLNLSNFPHSQAYANALKFPFYNAFSHAIHFCGGKNFSEYEKQNMKELCSGEVSCAESHFRVREEKYSQAQFAKIFQPFQFGRRNVLEFMLRKKVFIKVFCHLIYLKEDFLRILVTLSQSLSVRVENRINQIALRLKVESISEELREKALPTLLRRRCEQCQKTIHISLLLDT